MAEPQLNHGLSEPALRQPEGQCASEQDRDFFSHGGLKRKPLQVVAVVGAQWGDEGKGKLVDQLGKSANICARYNGGHNAGHTLLVNGRRVALHLLPCGVLQPNAINLIGNGVVVHLKSLFQELEAVRDVAPAALQRLLISSRAHLLFDFHAAVDLKQEEAARNSDSGAIGTTLRGIGPCYASKVSRLGVRVGDLLHWDSFEFAYKRLVAQVQEHFQELKGTIDAQEELERHRHYAHVLKDRIVDNVAFLHKELALNKTLLAEGANATLLDVDFGTYPFVTSSSAAVGGVSTGLGIPGKKLDVTIGVVKAYTTRVGEGPFPTEASGTDVEFLRSNGAEFGTTTGRPRRCGWLDIPLLRHAIRVNGFDCLNLTKLDVLTGRESIPVCVAYKDAASGEMLDDNYCPITSQDFARITPVYELLSGWKQGLQGCTSYRDLPENAQKYVSRIEELLGIPFFWIGVGPDRQHTIETWRGRD